MAYFHEGIISKSLLKEIELKRTKIEDNPEFYLALSSQLQANLDSYSKLYSWWIEHPDIRKDLLEETKNPKIRGKLIAKARKGIQRLHEGWRYLQRIDDPLNKQVLLNLSYIIEPEENNGVEFRNKSVTMSLENYTPPNHLKIEELLDHSFNEIREGNYHPIEKAVKSHITIAGIQPFMNGNKRIARLVQDKILRNSNLPNAIIPVGERTTYIELLEQALVGMRDYGQMEKCLNQMGLDFNDRTKVELRMKESFTKQQPFYHYIAGKINSSIDAILDDIFIEESQDRPETMNKSGRNIRQGFC